MKKLIDDRKPSVEVEFLSNLTNSAILGIEYNDGKRYGFMKALSNDEYDHKVIALHSNNGPGILRPSGKESSKNALRITFTEVLDSDYPNVHEMVACQDFVELYAWLGVPADEVLRQRYQRDAESMQSIAECMVDYPVPNMAGKIDLRKSTPDVIAESRFDLDGKKQIFVHGKWRDVKECPDMD